MTEPEMTSAKAWARLEALGCFRHGYLEQKREAVKAFAAARVAEAEEPLLDRALIAEMALADAERMLADPLALLEALAKSKQGHAMLRFRVPRDNRLMGVRCDYPFMEWSLFKPTGDVAENWEDCTRAEAEAALLAEKEKA